MMSTRSRTIVLAVGLASLALLWAGLFIARGPAKGLRFARLLQNLVAASEARRLTAKAELRQPGTDVLPELLSMLTSRDSYIRSQVTATFSTNLLHAIRIYSEEERQDLALEGFHALGTSAEPAIPALARLLTNPPMAGSVAPCLAVIGTSSVPVLSEALTNTNAVVRSRSALALGVVAPKAVGAIPQLIEALVDRERVVRSCAASALGMIRSEPGVVIPALTNRLSDREPLVRRVAIHAIKAFGSDAVPAISVLEDLVSNDPDPLARDAARSAVEHIREARLEKQHPR